MYNFTYDTIMCLNTKTHDYIDLLKRRGVCEYLSSGGIEDLRFGDDIEKIGNVSMKRKIQIRTRNGCHEHHQGVTNHVFQWFCFRIQKSCFYEFTHAEQKSNDNGDDKRLFHSNIHFRV